MNEKASYEASTPARGLDCRLVLKKVGRPI
jgi:hypothetical protein